MSDEVWKNVETHNGIFANRYQVSNLGRVRSHPDNRVQGSKKGHVLYQSKDENGYPQVYLHYASFKKMTVKVHRLVATAFLGEKPAGMTVDHINGQKSDNKASNLQYVTNKTNCRLAHKVVDGRSFVVVAGEKMCITEAVERFAAAGVDAKCVRRRIGRYGWTIEQALSTPKQATGRPSRNSVKARPLFSAAWPAS